MSSRSSVGALAIGLDLVWIPDVVGPHRSAQNLVQSAPLLGGTGSASSAGWSRSLSITASHPTTSSLEPDSLLRSTRSKEWNLRPAGPKLQAGSTSSGGAASSGDAQRPWSFARHHGHQLVGARDGVVSQPSPVIVQVALGERVDMLCLTGSILICSAVTHASHGVRRS